MNFTHEERRRRAEVMRLRHQDPAFAQARDERIRKLNKSPAQGARASARMRKVWAAFKASE